VTIDEAGHLYVWTYSEEFLSEGIIKPSHKYRIPLDYTKFERDQQKENKSATKTTEF